MTRKQRRLVLIAAPGCTTPKMDPGPSKDKDKGKDKDKDNKKDDHEHGEIGPHGGAIVEWDPYHGELMVDAETCLGKLEALGMRRFNAILHPVGGRWLQPTLDRWFLREHVSRADLLDALEGLRPNTLSGDLVAFG